MSAHSEIVPKPWGYEYCAFDNGKAAVWILHIARGRRTSRHAHPKKETRLIPLSGEVFIDLNGAIIPEGGSGPLALLSEVEIKKNTMHQTLECGVGVSTYSDNGAFIMEIEEPSDKGDIVREDDAYGRAGKPIESETVPCAVETLKLSKKEQSIMGYTFKLESTLGGQVPDLAVSFGGETLGIYKEKKRRLADCVADFVAAQGVKHVFGVSGGGSMHLNDAFGHHGTLKFIPTHHEQAAAMAAEAYSRVGGLGICLVTTGPGGTNALTGVACAWVDSIPLLVISGQVTRDTLMRDKQERQRGIQETDIVAMARPITKYAVTVMHEQDIRCEMEKAVYVAKSGRPGPVWVDIPLDLQGKAMDWEACETYGERVHKAAVMDSDMSAFYSMLETAKRPVLVIGNGVHLAGAETWARGAVEILQIPTLSSWTAADIVPTDNRFYIGRFGIFGDRASNFTIQNSDLIICVGSRLSIPQTGHNLKLFAREAKIVRIDVEEAKDGERCDLLIYADAGQFLKKVVENAIGWVGENWFQRAQEWKTRYPVVSSENREVTKGVNSFKFIEALSNALPDDAVVVTDMGTAFTCTFQAAKMKLGQRWLTASGHAPMGYGLPGAIGAHFATGKPVVCIVGDGALMFNLQELQTISHHRLPITIFVLNNGGYLTMKHTFANHFGRQTGSDDKSGVSLPEWWRVSNAFFGDGWTPELYLLEERNLGDLPKLLALPSPRLVEVRLPPDQPLIPRTSSVKLPNGQITSKPIEDLFPFLPREEFKAQMIVKPMEVFE